MSFLGRRLILTTLDPLPRAFRAAPGVLAINQREAAALKQNSGEVFKELADIVFAEDAAEARNIGKLPVWKRPKQKIKPSGRLFMLNAIYRGRASAGARPCAIATRL